MYFPVLASEDDEDEADDEAEEVDSDWEAADDEKMEKDEEEVRFFAFPSSELQKEEAAASV